MTGHDSGVAAAAFSPDGRLVASADQGGRIIVWDVESGNALRNLDGHNRQVLDLAFHPNGDALLSAANDDTYSVNGYVAMQVLAGGARQASSLDAEAVADALRTNAVNTLLGELSFESDGDLVDPQIWVYQVVGGEFVQVE